MRLLIILSILCFSGCTSLEIGRKKVPDPVEKTKSHVEAEKIGADYLARKVEKPVEAKEVARSLSGSLGRPKKEVDDASKVVQDLQIHVRKHEEEINALNNTLEQYSGKKIDGTGINVIGTGLPLSVIILIVLCILFPPIITVVFFIIKNLKRTIECLVSGVHDLVDNDPATGSNFLNTMSRRMDSAQKSAVKRAQKQIKKYR